MRILVLLTLFGFSLGNAQNTHQLKEGQQSPKATLDDVQWITGHWRGEALGGIAEEIWSPPMGESMMFSFRLVNEDKVSFYEIGHIIQVDSTLLMQLKHFNGNLKGWETKDETVDFKLVKLEKDKVFFEGLTMEKVNQNEMRVYVLIEESENPQELVFNYKRYQ
ncbi:DUF6265 family protein [Flagellimonas nanhaiensis]|uniref:DUF6265 domain-containing protein n=1 Tax=Flagellimonas nanhaiensis TaxID=2292706 RepID=A0A371JRK0_9FLAO|nr:DUF6265 family protein [Allomuricauda nanhaiensis]RDY60096.1 hypothetical protein DX873_12235 [Allomuricauda nanhaiensis]